MKTLILILTLGTIYSCNTVHKTTATVKENTDSVHVVKNEAAEVSKHDSVIVKESKGDYTEETVIEFDSTAKPYFNKSDLYYGDGGNGSGGGVLVIGRPTKVTIKKTGNYIYKDSGNYSNFDSAVAKQIDSAMKHQTVVAKNTDKKSIKVSFGLIIGVVVLLAVVFTVWSFTSKIPNIKKIDV